METNFEKCTLDKIVILTDEYENMYLGTITMARGKLVRGECVHGDPELFYRNKIIGWELYNPT